MKYLYPAIFKEENGNYNVEFPDIPNCFTFGENLFDALEMAEDALSLTLLDFEEKEKFIPKASDVKDVKVNKNDIVLLIKADTEIYRRKNSLRSVKKTLSIPEWLNVLAEENDINFSQVLQKALKKELKVN